MHVVRAILPHFRGCRAGTIINVASVGGHIAFLLYSLLSRHKMVREELLRIATVRTPSIQ